jgi:hypothetical protein
MAFFRQARGFERAGNLPHRKMDMPVARARQLTLLRAWNLIAGESLARQVCAVEIRRGVLELKAADPAWRAAIEPLLPALTGRLVGEYPKLGVVKYRVQLEGQPRPSSAIPIEPPATVEGGPEAPTRPAPPPVVDQADQTVDMETRLAALSRRYLDRQVQTAKQGVTPVKREPE